MARPEVSMTDMQILCELDLDPRAGVSEIAKRLRMSTNTVNKHISHLLRSGVIKGFSARIDFFRFGYPSFCADLRLQHAGREARARIMEHLVSSPYTHWCAEVEGKFDMACVFWCKSHGQFYPIWREFLDGFRQYLKEAVVVPYYGEVFSALPFAKKRQGEVQVRNSIGSTEPITLDGTDWKILRMLSKDGRASYRELSMAVGRSPAAVKKRMERLIGEKTITGFRMDLDLGKFGYTVYKADFILDSLAFKDRRELERYALGRQNVLTLVRSVGRADLELCIAARSHKELHSTLHDIRDGLSDGLREYSFSAFPKETKNINMPEF